MPRYFEDQPLAVQAAQRELRRAEIAAIARLPFPIRAEFGGMPVTILGPVDRFSPYKEQATGPEDPFQLMIQPDKGKKFITFASGLIVEGRPLVTRALPMRPRPNPFLGKTTGERAAIAPPILPMASKPSSRQTIRHRGMAA